MIQIDHPDDIYIWDTKELWNAIQQVMEEQDDEGTPYKEIYSKQLNQIKNGIHLKIPIYYITNEWYELYPASRKAGVRGYGKIDLNTFMKEKEERDNYMRHIILKNLEQPGTTEPRT